MAALEQHQMLFILSLANETTTQISYFDAIALKLLNVVEIPSTNLPDRMCASEDTDSVFFVDNTGFVRQVFVNGSYMEVGNGNGPVAGSCVVVPDRHAVVWARPTCGGCDSPIFGVDYITGSLIGGGNSQMEIWWGMNGNNNTIYALDVNNGRICSVDFNPSLSPQYTPIATYMACAESAVFNARNNVVATDACGNAQAFWISDLSTGEVKKLPLTGNFGGTLYPRAWL
eukprot:Phypoly_transcript_12319.p1 GENE.Phypoly_transcript_12319~~Phypoly_transcript_12319.p1  ORF type:complete len:229 (+),score=33.84 Phypoly_transcript_12319:399-1085(+)